MSEEDCDAGWHEEEELMLLRHENEQRRTKIERLHSELEAANRCQRDLATRLAKIALENARQRAALREIVTLDRWTHVEGDGEWRYGDCAKVAQEALAGSPPPVTGATNAA